MLLLLPGGGEREGIDSITIPVNADEMRSMNPGLRQGMVQAIIDALPAQIAILSDCGDIVAVNHAWHEGAERGDARMLRGAVDDCYLRHCDDPVAAGIHEVLQGARDAYSVEYESDDEGHRRWFSLRVTPLENAHPRYAVVTHEDISQRMQAELARNEMGLALDTLVQTSPLAISAVDNDHLVTAWNPAAEQLFGWTRDEVLGSPNPLVPDGKYDDFLAAWARIENGETPVGLEVQRHHKDGSVLNVGVSYAALTTAAGEARGAMAVFSDIRQQKRFQEEQRFLAEVSELLAASIDYEATLIQVAQMAVPRLADCCMVHLLENDSSIRRLAVAHADPARHDLAQQLKEHGELRLDESWGVPLALRSGKPIVYGEMPNSVWDVDEDRVEHMDIVRRLGMSSAMFVPLMVRERTIGTLTFIYGDSGRVYTDADLSLAEELARRSASAIDNARLYREARAAELRFRTLIEHIPAATYIAQADDLRMMTYVSPQMTGPGLFTAEALVTEPTLWLTLLHPDDRERVEETMLRCSASGEPLSIEYRIFTLAGEHRWMVDQATLIRDETGQGLYWLGICFDINERKQAEESLGSRVRQQAAVARLGQQALDDVDLDSFKREALQVVMQTLGVEYVRFVRYEHESETYIVEASSGLRPEGAVSLGKPVDLDSLAGYTLHVGEPVIVPDVAAETRFKPSERMLSHDMASALSVLVPGTPGPCGALLVGAKRERAFTDDDVHFLQAVGNLLAATIERNLNEEQIRFQADLLNVVNQAVIATDLNGTISYWNRFAEEVYGWSQEDVLGKNILDLGPSETSREQASEIIDLLRRGQSWSGEILQTHRDGSVFPALITDSPIRGTHGELIGIVGIATDITEWKQAEAEREGLVRDLGERVKELTVLHRAAALLQSDEHPIGEILDSLAAMLPQAMQYPGAAMARLAFGALQSTSPGYQSSPLHIQAEFSSGDVKGVIEVGYRAGSRVPDDRFHPEEVSLINTVADMLGAYLQRLETQAALHRSEARFRAAAEGSLDAFYILEAMRSNGREIVNYRIVSMNARGTELLESLSGTVPAATILEIFTPERLEPYFEMFNHVAMTGETVERELLFVTDDGSQRWLRHQVVPLADGVAMSVGDITDRTRLEQQLTHQAFHDALTGLPNRALFLDRVQHARKRANRRHEGIAVLFLDLDNFKYVNDSLGHSVGDQLLVAVARRLNDCVGKAGSAARLGGDEFAVLLEDLDDWGTATNIAETIVDAFQVPFLLAGREVFISPSIGVAIGALLETTAETLLRDADAAMYRAKRNGRARYEVFEPSLAVHALQRFELENDLRHAIARGEFRLHYQPIVYLDRDELCAFEALVRWEHPVHGTVAPLDFIPIAEETGLIIPIGRWVLEEACRQTHAWNLEWAGTPLMVCVNLSRRQFHDPDLSRHIAEALGDSGLEPHLLNLEITESVMMADERQAAETLTQLKATGIQLAIDDFGTGYSSLGMLRHFPVDTLKIDQAFVSGLETNPDDRVIVSAIIGLAHALNLTVVAEGTETAEHLERLKALGCDLAQGYFISKPLPAEELSRLLMR